MTELSFVMTDSHDRHGMSATANSTAAQPNVDQGSTSYLTFSDVPSNLIQLHTVDNNKANEHNKTVLPQNLLPTKAATRQRSNEPASASVTQSLNTLLHHSRKPSPGLAKRLRALGFGAPKDSPRPATIEPVGRLPEEQIRKLDRELQAALGKGSVGVERRGRAWSGAMGGAIALNPSRLSLDSSKPHTKPSDSSAIDIAGGSEAAKHQLVTAIGATGPPDMDIHHYPTSSRKNSTGGEHTLPDTRPPTPPPKDSPPLSLTAPAILEPFNPDAGAHFNPLGLQRPGSIYTLSRASFANQLAQLTSIQLPDADSLSSRVSAIPTAQAAARALIGAAEQIRGWIHKANEVVNGLDSEDDVEWAAAGGREGVEEVESAILRFEELINVYVTAIEELQFRDDIATVDADNLVRAVAQMEAILDEWKTIRQTLKSVKGQVEIAMEWEELWNNVLGDIQKEMDDLRRLVFEMEERRHRTFMAATSGDGVDIHDLETIVDETPPAMSRKAANRSSLPGFPGSPKSSSQSLRDVGPDDSSLLALFARMQPLKASLDFLPMRLSGFQQRAESVFPTSCDELEMRRSNLEGAYKKLENDADSLRKELGEDRWILVFRGAARQAQKMYDSVDRSLSKLREALDTGMHFTNQPQMNNKMDNLEAKKTHYGPAIERVLSIIDRGIKDRLTVNGEIVRLHAELATKWEELKSRIAETDICLEELQADSRAQQQLRDSVSSMLSYDRSSTLGSGHETPQSSPPSSVVMSGLGSGISAFASKAEQRSTSAGRLPQPASRRKSLIPVQTSQAARTPVVSRLSALSTPPREGSTIPAAHGSSRSASSLPDRPRWNAATNPTRIDTGHNFKPLTLTTPSPYAKLTPSTARSKTPLTPSSAANLHLMRAFGSRPSSSSPIPKSYDTLSKSTPSSRQTSSCRDRLSPPRSHSRHSLPRPLVNYMSTANGDRRTTLHLPAPDVDIPRAMSRRPATSLATIRRPIFLPQQKSHLGRATPQSDAALRSIHVMPKLSDTQPKENKPRWRG